MEFLRPSCQPRLAGLSWQHLPADGIQVLEWGTHDRIFGTTSDPADLLDEIRRRHGDHPVDHRSRATACDGHGHRPERYEDLLDRLLDGIERRTALLSHLLAGERWDLFTCAFTEPRCAGHQFWHLTEGAPACGGARGERLRQALRAVYEQVDAGVGELIRTAGPDATILVVASHGMGPLTGGSNLLPEVLVRLGTGSGAGLSAQVRSRLPIPFRELLRRLTPASARARLQEAAGSLPNPLLSPTTRAIALENDRVGAIRLNLRGREPFGAVEPGPDAEALIDELRHELHQLVDPRTSLAACRSPRVGLVRVPVHVPAGLPRTGQHMAQCRLWAAGPRVRAETGEGSILDVAPTVLTLLGVTPRSSRAGR